MQGGENPHEIKEESLEDQHKDEIILIHSLKRKLQADISSMLKDLDGKHEKYQKSYQSCYQTTCQSIFDKIKNYQEKTFEVNLPQNKSHDKQDYFMHGSLLNDSEEYNRCVETCQKPIRDIRFELEFQMREFQISLNECFHFCKLDTGSPIDCNIRCLNLHNGFIQDKIAPKLQRVYETGRTGVF